MKKGFTLVELLAVMTVLSLIIVLISSNVLKTKSKADEKAMDIEKQNIIDASVSYYMAANSKYAEGDIENKTCKITLKTLRDTKYYEADKYIGNINDNTYVAITASNGSISARIIKDSEASSIAKCTF